MKELYESSPRLSSGRIEDANKAELLQLIEKSYAEISAHNESKALLTVLVTPITLGGGCCNHLTPTCACLFHTQSPLTFLLRIWLTALEGCALRLIADFDPCEVAC